MYAGAGRGSIYRSVGRSFGGVGRLSTPQGESVATALVRWGVPYSGRG